MAGYGEWFWRMTVTAVMLPGCAGRGIDEKNVVEGVAPPIGKPVRFIQEPAKGRGFYEIKQLVGVVPEPKATGVVGSRPLEGPAYSFNQDYFIQDYPELIERGLSKEDLVVMEDLLGILFRGNYLNKPARDFFGVGVLPDEEVRMRVANYIDYLNKDDDVKLLIGDSHKGTEFLFEQIELVGDEKVPIEIKNYLLKDPRLLVLFHDVGGNWSGRLDGEMGRVEKRNDILGNYSHEGIIHPLQSLWNKKALSSEQLALAHLCMGLPEQIFLKGIDSNGIRIDERLFRVFEVLSKEMGENEARRKILRLGVIARPEELDEINNILNKNGMSILDLIKGYPQAAGFVDVQKVMSVY